MCKLIKVKHIAILFVVLLLMSFAASASIFKKKSGEKVLDNVSAIVAKNKKKALKKSQKEEGTYSLEAGEFIHQYVIDANMQEYLISIKDRLLEGHDFEFKNDVNIYVTFGTDYTAHATSGFNIFIPSIWINDAESVDSIAALVAHELSHLILFHPPTSIRRKKQEGTVSKFASYVVMGAVIANTKINKNNGKYSLGMGKNADKKIRNTILVSQLMVEAKTRFINPRLNRKQEEQADFLAIDLLQTAGYNVLGVVEMFKPLKNKEEDDAAIVAKILELIKASQVEFDNQAKALLVSGQAESAVNTYLNGWVNTRAKMMSFKVSNFIAKKRSTHLLPSVREEKAMSYNSDNYPPKRGKVKQTLSEEEFQQRKVISKFSQIHNLHVEVSALNENINNKNHQQTAKEVYSIINKLKRVNKNSIYTMPWVVFGKVRLIQGLYKDAEENLYKHVINNKKVKDIPLDAYTLLAETYIRSDQMDKAQDIIELGAIQFGGDDSPFQIHQAMMACLSKDNVKYKEVIETCTSNPEPSINIRCFELESNIEVGKIKFLEDESYQWWQGCALDVPFTTVTLSNVERKNKLIAYEETLKKRARGR